MQQRVLITGASRGIGRATACAFAAAGWQVAAHYHTGRAEALSLVAALQAAGATAVAVGANLSDSTQAAQAVAQAEEALGGLDCVVCNAGIGCIKLLPDTTDDDWRRVMGANLDGAFYTLRAAVPGMVRRQSGSIVTVSSMWGQVGASCEVAYSAAKAGVIGLTKALAKELGPSHIRVNCVAPGVIDTQMNGALTQADLDALAQETPLGRIGTPQEVAQAILYLAGPGASFLTGQVIAPNGGIVI